MDTLPTAAPATVTVRLPPDIAAQLHLTTFRTGQSKQDFTLAAIVEKLEKAQ